MRTSLTVFYFVGDSVETDVFDTTEKVITQITPCGAGRVKIGSYDVILYARPIKISRVVAEELEWVPACGEAFGGGQGPCIKDDNHDGPHADH